jgi:transposase InsO family protein
MSHQTSHQIQQRLKWVQMYEETGDAGLVCRRCGISRPTLRLWYRRYQENGVAGLHDQSRRPRTSPAQKVLDKEQGWILSMRKRRLGARRIRSELKRNHDCSLSLATIHKILVRHDQNILEARRKSRKGKRRYQRPIPGERVQVDVCKIRPGLYQYSAIDDCTRFRILAVYPRKTISNSVAFLELVLEEIPFPIQRIQSDRGGEFFGHAFQQRLMDYAIKFRPIKPASPHLNGKVERSQKTDLEEFWATIDLNDKSLDLPALLRDWQDYYNHERPHSSLRDQTPWEKWQDLVMKTPLHEEVEAMYDDSKERIQEQNYSLDLQLRTLKASL